MGFSLTGSSNRSALSQAHTQTEASAETEHSSLSYSRSTQASGQSRLIGADLVSSKADSTDREHARLSQLPCLKDSPTPVVAKALRNQTHILKQGDLTHIQIGDVIGFDHPDLNGHIPFNSPFQFVVDAITPPGKSHLEMQLCLRDASRAEQHMHNVLVNIAPLREKNFSHNFGKQSLYKAFIDGLENSKDSQQSCHLSLMTSPRHAAISRALKGIDEHQCTFLRVNADVSDMLISKSPFTPTIVEKNVFDPNIGILAKKGDNIILKEGDTLSIRRLINFKLESVGNMYWLTCTHANASTADLQGQSFKLGPKFGHWQKTLSRDFFRTSTPLISSQQGRIKNNPKTGLKLSLSKDQSTLWMGIMRG